MKAKEMKTNATYQLTGKVQSAHCVERYGISVKRSKIEKNMRVNNKINDFEDKKPMIIACLLKYRDICKKNNSFFTPRVYLFLNLPVAFNKN
ncbi:MAG TPA: hypothetical protein VK890_13465 [Bacteroidia bacterium]|nr:hypothetical protein [Bacteroidia bacterium]